MFNIKRYIMIMKRIVNLIRMANSAMDCDAVIRMLNCKCC